MIMIGAPNTETLSCMLRVVKGVSDTSVSSDLADIFRNYYIDNNTISIANTIGMTVLQSAKYTEAEIS